MPRELKRGRASFWGNVLGKLTVICFCFHRPLGFIFYSWTTLFNDIRLSYCDWKSQTDEKFSRKFVHRIPTKIIIYNLWLLVLWCSVRYVRKYIYSRMYSSATGWAIGSTEGLEVEVSGVQEVLYSVTIIPREQQRVARIRSSSLVVDGKWRRSNCSFSTVVDFSELSSDPVQICGRFAARNTRQVTVRRGSIIGGC